MADYVNDAGVIETPNASVPRQKRLACLICRRRKLKCDGRRPSCSTCSRLGHSCAYDEVRKKSGPKRGYVKALEERLKQVEVMLKTQDAIPSDVQGFSASDAPGSSVPSGMARPGGRSATTASASAAAAAAAAAASASAADFGVADPTIGIASSRDMDRWQFNAESPPRPGSLDDLGFAGPIPVNLGAAADSNFTYEIINLGLNEPLPPQETIDELQQLYFDKIHPSLPMIHKYRYLAAMNLAPNQRPPVCLRYAMWTLASSVTDKFTDLQDHFYHRARKYLEADLMKGYGEQIISVAHCQTHIILASYEFKMMYFPRAWMSTGQAARLAQMMGLHRLDGKGLDVKQCIPPPRDWTETEERRRTFWMAFCQDRYASIGTGWPMTFDERDMATLLPTSEEAFEMSRPERSVMLHDAMSPAGVGQLTPFAGIVLMACLFGRNLVHLHRPDVDDKDDDLNGEYWKRHRNLDNILLNTLLGLPAHLKLPAGLQSPNIVFTNMCIHTSTICLHQAAIFKAESNGLAASVSPESKVRCITAANEIASIMRMVSHIDLSTMNPFISFCLYVAARVFVQFLKTRPNESQIADSLRFLLTAMSALRRKNPLTQSFLVQLDVDLEVLGDRIPSLRDALPRSTDGSPPMGMENRNGAVCEEGPGDGILSYQREISKSHNSNVDDNTASSAGPDTAEDSFSRDRHSASGSTDASAHSSNIGSGAANSSSTASAAAAASAAAVAAAAASGVQGWLGPDSSLPTRDRSSAGPSPGLFSMQSNGYPDQGTTAANGMLGGSGGASDIHDMSTSPGDGMSNRLTPNSSTASEHRHGLAPPGAGSGSFENSPVSPSRGPGTGSSNAASASGNGGGGGFVHSSVGYYSTSTHTDYHPPSMNGGGNVNGSMHSHNHGHSHGHGHNHVHGHGNNSNGGSNRNGPGGPSGMHMQGPSTAALAGLMTAAQQQVDYGISQSWDLQSQTPMAPVSEGMLRTIMQMGPMETMDLGWESNP